MYKVRRSNTLAITEVRATRYTCKVFNALEVGLDKGTGIKNGPSLPRMWPQLLEQWT